MNKKQFFDELRFYLVRAVKAGEVEDVIRDYEEYFAEGLAEGKTEEEIIEGLGSPRKIVDDMIEGDADITKENGETGYGNADSQKKKYYTYDDSEAAYYKRFHLNKKNNATSILEKVIGYSALILIDFIYFIFVGSIGFSGVVTMGALTIVLPTWLNLNSVVGASKFLIIFPTIFFLSGVVFFGMITYYLIKLGIFLNKKIIASIEKTEKIGG